MIIDHIFSNHYDGVHFVKVLMLCHKVIIKHCVLVRKIFDLVQIFFIYDEISMIHLILSSCKVLLSSSEFRLIVSDIITRKLN